MTQAKKKALATTQPESLAEGINRGLRLAAKSARKTARMYGTPI